MTNHSVNFAALLEDFFTRRLIQQRQASPHTISSYRDTFRLFLKFVQQRLHKPPSRLNFEEIDAPLIVAPRPLRTDSAYSLKRKAAPGVDGVTWQEYEVGLEDRLVDLQARVHRGAYRAQPSRRVYIPKSDGRQRPLGVAALEDKIVQQATVTILNQIYEEDFLGFSYGFRPGRSQHQALDALSYVLLKKKVNYVLDADIRGFFDNLDKSWLIKFMEHRVPSPHPTRQTPTLCRLTPKFLNHEGQEITRSISFVNP